MTLQDELLELEELFWTGGPEVWARHCDATCLVAFAEMSGPMSREYIGRLAEEGRWHDLAMLPRGIVPMGEDFVILTYEASAVRRGEAGQPPAAHHAVVSSACRRGPEGWKLVFHQQTPKPPEGQAPAED
jgi:hypothetical protein